MAKVGNNINSKKGNWNFSKKKVVNNFENHINKSVPLYREGHKLIIDLSDFFLKRNSVCYDIGCSTGELLKKIDNSNTLKIFDVHQRLSKIFYDQIR